MTYGDPTPTSIAPTSVSGIVTAVPDYEMRAIKLRKANAQAEGAEHDADLAHTLSQAASLAYRRDARRNAYDEAGDYFERIFRFAVPVSSASSLATIDQIGRWDRLDNAEGKPARPYYLYFTTPGGDIFPGISLYAAIKALGERRPVITVASGFVASMGTVLHQAGTVRLIERGSTYLIHNASAGAMGEVHSLMDTAKWIGRINDDLHRILAERSKLSTDQIAERAERRDWTLTAEETVENGFADAIAGSAEAEALIAGLL